MKPYIRMLAQLSAHETCEYTTSAAVHMNEFGVVCPIHKVALH